MVVTALDGALTWAPLLGGDTPPAVIADELTSWPDSCVCRVGVADVVLGGGWLVVALPGSLHSFGS